MCDWNITKFSKDMRQACACKIIKFFKCMHLKNINNEVEVSSKPER